MSDRVALISRLNGRYSGEEDTQMDVDPDVDPDVSGLFAALDAEVEGAVNLRDLGGLPAGDRSIRRGRLFRSGMTHAIPPEGLRHLATVRGVRTVIDFRNQNELEHDGVSAFEPAGIRHVHLPVIGTTATTPESREVRVQRMRELMDGTLSWSVSYRNIIDQWGAAYVRFFEALVQPDTLAAVFHCAAGRDRTGIAAALVLQSVGVADEVIVADYHATGGHLQPHAHRYARVASDLDMSIEEVAQLLMTRPEAMSEFLAYLGEQYGGAERYLVTNGLDRAVIAELRGRLLEERSPA